MCTCIHRHTHVNTQTHAHASHTHTHKLGVMKHFVTLGKKKTDDVKEEPEEVTRAREELAAKRAKFPGLCLPDNMDKAEVQATRINQFL